MKRVVATAWAELLLEVQREIVRGEMLIAEARAVLAASRKQAQSRWKGDES